MRVSGFTFVRNAVSLDYPVLESIDSALPIVDEMVVNVGDSSDGTRELIDSIDSPKIRIISSRWDPEVRSGGRMLAIQADLALSRCAGDWALYLQADEVIHEEDYDRILAALHDHLDDREVEGLLFEFVHFYGNYHTIGVGRKWYDREIRAVRPGIGIRAWKDAQGFRLNGRKLRVVDSGAKVYHYGWARDPIRMKTKVVELAKLWHDDLTVERKYSSGAPSFVFDTGGKTAPFRGTHPRAMKDRVGSAPRIGGSEADSGTASLKHRVLDWLDERLGRRIGAYKNYSLLREDSKPAGRLAGNKRSAGG